MPHRRLCCAAHRCGKTGRLVQAAHDALAAGVAPGTMLALAPRAAAAAHLRESLRAATGVDIPTTTLRRRAIATLESHPDAAHLPPGWADSDILSGIDRRLLMHAAWESAGSSHGSLWRERGDNPGALDWIARLFDRWSAWSGTANPDRLATIQPADPHLNELWRAYLGYLRLGRELGVVAFAEVYNRAADALRLSGRPESAPRVLLLDDLDRFDSSELLFVAALTHAHTDMWASAVVAPDAASPLASERWLARWLDHYGFEIDSSATHKLDPPRLALGEYASPDDEAEAIAARIAALDDPSDAAIIAFDPELPLLLRRSLPRLGVAVEGQDARDGYSLALAPLALAGLKLLAGQSLAVAESQTLVAHPVLGLAHADVHRLAEASRDGLLDPFDLRDSRRPDGLSDDGWTRLMAVRAAMRVARESSTLPSTQLERWLESSGLAERAWAQTDAALPSWAAQLDRRHWARLMAFLRQTEALRRRLATPLLPTEAVQVFESAQALIEPEAQSDARAVRICGPDQADGVARHVFVAGLHEGSLPQPIPPLPLADDSTLEAAFGSLPGFVAPQIEDRAAAWLRGVHDLERAVGRSGESAHLSYSRVDRNERRRLPSPILAARLHIAPDRHGSLLRNAAAQGIATDSGGAESPWISQRRSDQVTRSMIRLHPSLPADERSHESPFEVSPSAIEDWFACPRRCFFARRLNLYDIASSPRQALGMAVHATIHNLLLESAFGAVSDARALELLDESWSDDPRRWGSRLKAQVFRQLAERAVLHVARHERERSDGAVFAGGELTFRWPMPGSDVVVKGRVDRVDAAGDGLHVIDYKLGNHNPSINELLREFTPPSDTADSWRPGDIQLPVYALALEGGEIEGLAAQPESRVRRVSLVFPLELYDDRGKPRAVARRTIEIVDHLDGCAACESPPARAPKTGLLCRQQLAMIEERVRVAVAGMRAGQWQPDPRDGSQTCASCAFRPICPDPR